MIPPGAEPLVGDTSARRELVVFAWYPAEGTAGTARAAYIPHLPTIAAAIGDSGMNAEFGTARAGIEANLVRSHSFNSPPVRKAGRPFPTVIFSPGFAESSLTYATQLEDLASHGYIVIGIEHPFDTYAVLLAGNRVIAFARAGWDSAMTRPKGAAAYQLAQVPLRAADIRFVLDQLERLVSGFPVRANLRAPLTRTGSGRLAIHWVGCRWRAPAVSMPVSGPA